eukprot:2067030-Pyramimonas_sp.AAC.1
MHLTVVWERAFPKTSLPSTPVPSGFSQVRVPPLMLWSQKEVHGFSNIHTSATPGPGGASASLTRASATSEFERSWSSLLSDSLGCRGFRHSSTGSTAWMPSCFAARVTPA